jgi:hypothetical protein
MMSESVIIEKVILTHTHTTVLRIKINKYTYMSIKLSMLIDILSFVKLFITQ